MKRNRKLTEQEEIDEEANRRANQPVPGVGAYRQGQLVLRAAPMTEEQVDVSKSKRLA